LVLTPPAEPTELDDGLLTVSEVAGLTLDAEWVIMSACNTAGSRETDAEALSGLARAFFYAGARALLVSRGPYRLRTFQFARSMSEVGERRKSGSGIKRLSSF
jgi:hypothetical protein